MSITMQGTWTISVKEKNGSFTQSFEINGSDASDARYDDVEPGTPAPITVTGDQWSITCYNKANDKEGPWYNSGERVSQPRRVGGKIEFDILVDDAGGSDHDYDDLILTCSCTESSSEYVIWGRVRTYPDNCPYNPCFPTFVVVDTWLQFGKLLRYKDGRDELVKMYPDRVKEFEEMEKRPWPFPLPDPPPFRPIMVRSNPVEAEMAAQPAHTLTLLKSRRVGISTNAAPGAGASVENLSASASLDKYRALSKYKDLFRVNCDLTDQAGLLLRFVEYDRTAEELVGGPYTGEGSRHTLGLTVTDNQGGYIFRFSAGLEHYAEEMEDIESSGGTVAHQLRPDLLVQVVDGGTEDALICYETGLYENITNLKRVNICVPQSELNPDLEVQTDTRIIQAIGNVYTVAGVGNSLDGQGRITSTNSLGPIITKGAWVGGLHLFGYFGPANPIKYYTLRYRRLGETGWSFVSQNFKHPKISDIGTPGYTGTPVGPFYNVELHVDGAAGTFPAHYLNIENDHDWVATHRVRKIILNSHIYAPESAPGSIEFRIDGYDNTGHPVVNGHDTIRLFIDNRPVAGDVDHVQMGTADPGECAFFEMPTPDQPLTVRFKADQPGGFMTRYQFSVTRGSGTNVPVADVNAPPEILDQTYDQTVHGDAFYGTLNGQSPDSQRYVTADLRPTGGSWLPTGKTFCAFSFRVGARPRVTNGYGLGHWRHLGHELVGLSYDPAVAEGE